MKGLYYKRDGTPYEGLEAFKAWGKDFEQERHIGDTTLPNGTRISTVWLGIDHQWGYGPPLIFETMVFAPDSFEDEDMERYATEEEARAGHDRMVEKWKNKIEEESCTKKK